MPRRQVYLLIEKKKRTPGKPLAGDIHHDDTWTYLTQIHKQLEPVETDTKNKGLILLDPLLRNVVILRKRKDRERERERVLCFLLSIYIMHYLGHNKYVKN